MKIKYECDYCHKQFDNMDECQVHEVDEHIENPADKFKYITINMLNDSVCSYCKNQYYVYGCEPDCQHKDCGYNNNYKDFIWNGET